jgi:DNA polymerase III delta subunit
MLDFFFSGFNDKQVSSKIGITYDRVMRYRKSQGISVKQVLEKKFDTWETLLNQGWDLQSVANEYGVLPSSVKNMLYQNRNFSIKRAKNIALAKAALINTPRKTRRRIFGE